MLPSEKLRNEIEKRHKVNLNQYAWTEELNLELFSIILDEYIETHATTLKEVYELGFNIGHCGLTSRYVCRQFDNAALFYGTANLLIGTPSSPNGEHAWTLLNDYLIDTTLMISVPVEKARELGYAPKKEIAHLGARILSEFDTYESEYKKMK